MTMTMARTQVSPEQAEALQKLHRGRNALLTGVAGTGKSFTGEEFLRTTKKRVAVTASTGVAAVLIGGQTAHSWMGAGRGDEPLARIVTSPYFRRKIKPVIEETEVLLLDEVSMLGAETFTLFDHICRYARHDNETPFGGLQLVLVGDFGQLAPVKEAFCFQSEAWREAGIETVELREVRRQQDAAFSNALRKVRDGDVSPEVMTMFKGRVNAFDPEQVQAMRLYTHNANVDDFNRAKLLELPGRLEYYRAIDDGPEATVAKLDKDCLSPRVLELKPGARVMFTKNKQDFYANGTLGTVRACSPGRILVTLDDGGEVHVEQAEWKLVAGRDDRGNEVAAHRVQYPLKLAWAQTIHKSQGATIDKVSTDLKRCFATGQAYVALSRVRSLSGLNLEAYFSKTQVKASAAVREFYAGGADAVAEAIPC